MHKLLFETMIQELLLLVLDGPGNFFYYSHLVEAFDGTEHFIYFIFSFLVVGCPIDFESFEFSSHCNVSMCINNYFNLAKG
jgi:hypothetical protein